jgi:23S rRNA (cytosine1962-C5)-methyltransferase
MKTVVLKPGRDKSLLRRHPWVYSGAIQRISGDAQAGETVTVQDREGNFLCLGAYSPESQIRVRAWTFDPQDPVDSDFFRSRLQAAINARLELLIPATTNAYRLVHGESDRLPGLIIDHYGEVLVLQFLSAGPEHWRETIVDNLWDLLHPACIYERSDVDVRRLEGLPERTGILRGELPSSQIEIQEGALRFLVDVVHGHKTGFYLDQRANRARVAQLAQGREVLDGFCYTGGFSMAALKNGARSVLAIDASEEALAGVREHIALNGLDEGQIALQPGNVFALLRTLRDSDRQFDMVILDPPKFAPSASHAERAARGYKDINLLALKLLRPGGILATFSCSGGISAELFQKIVAGAALDAGVEARILERLTQAADHPVALSFPEGEYLKGLIVQVVGN